jgi:hypothetical protein
MTFLDHRWRNGVAILGVVALSVALACRSIDPVPLAEASADAAACVDEAGNPCCVDDAGNPCCFDDAGNPCAPQCVDDAGNPCDAGSGDGAMADVGDASGG